MSSPLSPSGRCDDVASAPHVLPVSRDDEVGTPRALPRSCDEVDANSARTRARFPGIVALEGGGLNPHPVGGGACSCGLAGFTGRRR
jgi:hypothetical protein